MTTSDIFGKERSDVSSGNDLDAEQDPIADPRNTDWRPTCPECEARVVSTDSEATCSECGLVVHVDALEREPTLQAQAPGTDDRSGEWAIEPTQRLRVDKGLTTTFFVTKDGHGNPLSGDRRSRMARLKARHKRFTMADHCAQRLNEAFRDAGLLRANLELPDFVTHEASQYLEVAKQEQLPGGHIAWEALAAGAVLLVTRRAGIDRSPGEIARYAKASEERVCAAARKIRTQTDVETPPVRTRAVDRVVAALDGAGVDLPTGVELLRVADRLMEVADAEPIGPGTSRLTVAGAAVYAADRLTDGKVLTLPDVVAAVEQTLPTSQNRIKRYAARLRDVAPDRCQPALLDVDLATAD